MKIQETKNGQWTVTIPKNLVAAMQLRRGDDFQIILNKSGNLELIKIQGGSVG